MFTKILIANRGEIACRVARTARRLGIATVAVYSDADASAAHVAACDEAYRIGPSPPRESYLNGARILEVARASGAQAIHPGYGFLSENEAFARACAEAGAVFIGPPPSAIAAMGSKSAAKAIMGKAGVPLVPGYHGDDQDPALLAKEAARIGFPVLIKATAGGGGKGMRIVQKSAEFDAALASCKREARSAFGDDAVLIERYVQRPRHIEIQVFADAHGNCVSLFERDCSVQRRHQKVIEEAPAPGVARDRVEGLAAEVAAVLARLGYDNIGTVEMLLGADGGFTFLEMNTRLQVEHGVTEMILDVDLVGAMIRIAGGARVADVLPRAIAIRGHAIQARIYAEDPKTHFPSPGTLTRFRPPPATPSLRVETGFAEGMAVTPHYDPMVAKIIAHAPTRGQAIAALDEALRGFEIAGIKTNIPFLHRVLASDAFVRGDVHTDLAQELRG